MKPAGLWVLILLLSACAVGEPPTDLSESRRAVRNAATAQIGAPYVYGGTTRRGFDAPGLCQFVYDQAGIDIPRYLDNQRAAGEPIGFAAARPGDLLVYELDPDSRLAPSPHVGVYIGDGEMIHAATDRGEVSVETVDNAFWRKRFMTGLAYLP